jgi:hypothetical protein
MRQKELDHLDYRMMRTNFRPQAPTISWELLRKDFTDNTHLVDNMLFIFPLPLPIK